MVYFKLSQSILSLVKKARLEGLVGCQVYCDRQYISYADLEQVVLKLQFQYNKAKESKARRKEIQLRREEAKKSKDPERLKQVELIDFIAKN